MSTQPPSSLSRDETTLRLVWPQWQGGGLASVTAFFPEQPVARARRGYAVGAAVLEAVLPEHAGPTAHVPVDMSDAGLELVDGVEAKDAVVTGLGSALRTLAQHPDASRVLTLGGECSVSVAPFSVLADRYADDLAVVWIDSHPDVGTPSSEYPGYHAMAVAALTGHGDPDLVGQLPAVLPGCRVALAGLHSWTDDDIGNAAEWGISTFAPGDLRASSDPLLAWLAGTGCSKVAIHLDVDVVDSEEAVLGLGIEPHGLTTTQVQRVVADIAARHDVVGLTIAEFIPRQVMQLQDLVDGMPLV
ncbi:arginase family protein [Nocardioides bruguierae]|uniref:Arginase family protein n=1 Tax=Nocardioides bruguierae TaxID=2945102 RepID=A0A9X2IFV7_9ACTN|nr:arginase family protein [Nocardioides bruguierae]MCM0621398.1 arginase family protein [Nocardioides bruguierae]